MTSHIVNLSRCICLMLFICCSQLIMSQSFTNPIGSMADPHITYIDGYYYYTGTTGDDVSMKRSLTLEGLKQTSLIRLFGPGDTGAQAGNYWAPELFKLDGNWYIYYTAPQTGTNTDTQRTYVLENTSPDPLSNNWVFKGKVSSPGSDYWSIDGTILELSGNRYFLWSGISATTHYEGYNKPQRIYISLMSNLWTLSGARTLLLSPGELSGSNIGNVVEAPSILIKDNKIFLTYSANGCWTSEYKLGIMSLDISEDPLNINSWAKDPDPVFVSNPVNNSYGPGHNSFFSSPNETEFWLAYHATPNPSGECGDTRTTRAQKLTFNSNGIPQFGEVRVVGEPLEAPAGEPNLSTGIIANGLYKINQKNTTKLVEISGAVNINPADIVQWEDNGGLQQQWWIQSTGDGYYTIISNLSGLAMEVGACELNEFANINIWTPNGASCQLWAIEDLGSGDYKFINKNSDKVMEVTAAGIDNNGSNIQQSTWENSNNQKFNLELIGEALNVDTLNFDADIIVYPNPANNKFAVSGLNSVGKKHIKILSMLGKIVGEYKTNKSSLNINTNHIQSGLYIIQIASESYKTVFKKIVVNKK